MSTLKILSKTTKKIWIAEKTAHHLATNTLVALCNNIPSNLRTNTTTTIQRKIGTLATPRNSNTPQQARIVVQINCIKLQSRWPRAPTKTKRGALTLPCTACRSRIDPAKTVKLNFRQELQIDTRDASCKLIVVWQPWGGRVLLVMSLAELSRIERTLSEHLEGIWQGHRVRANSLRMHIVNLSQFQPVIQ